MAPTRTLSTYARQKAGRAPVRPAEQSERYLEQILGLRPNRIAYADPSADGKALLVRFGDNRSYTLGLDDIEDFDEKEIADARTDMDGAEVVVIGVSGREATIPWDYILYKCEPGYVAALPLGYDRELDSRMVGRRIRSLREDRGMDITTFAKLSGLARPNVHRLEGGLHRPQMETLSKAAKALSVAITDLLRTR
jgi:DNA-binding XRE family transcriptional regulator